MVLAVIVFEFYSTTSSRVYGTFMTKKKGVKKSKTLKVRKTFRVWILEVISD
jgi:hypothetical protein